MTLLSNPTSLSTNLVSFTVLIPNKTLKTTQLNLSNISNSPSFSLQYQVTHFSFHSLLHKKYNLLHKRCNFFCGFALNKRNNGSTAAIEVSDLDEDDEFDDWYDEEDDEAHNIDDDNDDEDEGMFLPFGKMQKWLESKPRGFGEGKVYDTSIEDKLLEEIEQSKQAQAANINTLKNNPIKPDSKTDKPKKKELEVVPGGICVRVVNLPKKKNVHRDLKAAFKEVPGIVNIIPAVSGNKKTKDPICKGFAFIDFKSEDDAVRFVRQFSRQNVAFGKIQKQIKCEMPNSHSSISSDDESAGSFYSTLTPALEEEFNNDFDINDSSLEASASDVSDDPDDELLTASLEDVSADGESFSISELNGSNRVKPAVGSLSSRKQDRRTKKKVIAKERGVKLLKLDIPGSAKRLKIKEKAVLTDVFAKYGSQAVLPSRDES